MKAYFYRENGDLAFEVVAYEDGRVFSSWPYVFTATKAPPISLVRRCVNEAKRQVAFEIVQHKERNLLWGAFMKAANKNRR